MSRFVDSWLIPLVSIFFIVDPLAAIPAYLTMTAGDSLKKRREGIDKIDISITPLAIPLLAGPGAISTVMVLAHRSASWSDTLPVYFAILLTGIATYVLLSFSAFLQRALGRTGIHVLSRIMGLVLATIAVQFVLDGLRAGGYLRP